MEAKFLIWPVLLGLLAGCAGTSVKPESKEISLEQRLPLRLAVDMSPGDLALQTHNFYNIHGYFETYHWTAEGKLVQNAALTAFAPLVEQVLPRNEMPVPDMIIRVRGRSIYNPMAQAWYVDVTATGYLANGAEVGSFQAESVAEHVLVFHEEELENTYVAAFQDIGRKFLRSGAMNEAMRQRAIQ
ncbi:MAG TPA: hypothetical protein VEG37_08105 [Burkholderiales bacterium]|nr:hypothetical protein [Burkholderiales bacterium]